MKPNRIPQRIPEINKKIIPFLLTYSLSKEINRYLCKKKVMKDIFYGILEKRDIVVESQNVITLGLPRKWFSSNTEIAKKLERYLSEYDYGVDDIKGILKIKKSYKREKQLAGSEKVLVLYDIDTLENYYEELKRS